MICLGCLRGCPETAGPSIGHFEKSEDRGVSCTAERHPDSQDSYWQTYGFIISFMCTSFSFHVCNNLNVLRDWVVVPNLGGHPVCQSRNSRLASPNYLRKGYLGSFFGYRV